MTDTPAAADRVIKTLYQAISFERGARPETAALRLLFSRSARRAFVDKDNKGFHRQSL